jgi:hypothetical protein
LAAAIENFSPLTLSYKLSTPELRPADYNASLTEERKTDVIRNLLSEGQFSMAGDTMTYQGKLSSADGTLYNVPYKGLQHLTLANQSYQNYGSTRWRHRALDGEYSLKEPAPLPVATSAGIDVKELWRARHKADRICAVSNADETRRQRQSWEK